MLNDLLYEKGEVKFPYILHLPEDYDPAKKYPLILFLHGAGERGENFEHYRIALPKMLKQGYTREAIILCPQCPLELTWNLLALNLKKYLDDMIKQYNADEDQILITGLSMGGYGTWEMISSFPDVFAAAGPICGGGIFWRAERIGKMPVRVYHGLADTIVPPVNSEIMVEALKAKGGSVEYFPLEGVNHNSWDYAYEKAGLIDWLLEHKRA